MRRAGLGVIMALVVLAAQPSPAYTNFLVTRGASAVGSVMITYAADAHDFYGELSYAPPGVHQPGAMRDVFEWDTGKFPGQFLLVKSPDRNVKTPTQEVTHPGYDESWYRRVAAEEGERLQVQPQPEPAAEGE